MANRLYQNVIRQMQDAVDRTIGVLDRNGIIIASSDESLVGESRVEVKDAYTGEQTAVIEGTTYRYIGTDDRISLIAFVGGDDDYARKTVSLISVSLSNMKELYDEKYDRNSFIKNIMLDNILPSDIFIKSREMQFDADLHHILMIIRFNSHTDVIPLEIVRGMFPDESGDYVMSVGENDVVLVKQAESGDVSEYEALAQSIYENVGQEFLAKVSIGVSSMVDNLKDLAKAYKEARISLEVGKVFDIEKNVLCYENLGIGRLIYQLPTTLCDVFLSEVFRRGSLESLDADTLMTVQAFFKNNLNVSETSRALFVHRNTLVYRLEKIRKITGLDLRLFEDAVTFKVALMVKKYLTNKPTKF